MSSTISSDCSLHCAEMGIMMRAQPDRIKLNVGGKLFETSRTTLACAGRDSMLGAMIHNDWNTNLNNSEEGYEYFIDRNPAYFSVLLDLLRTGELHIPPNMSEKALYREALYYGLLDLVRVSQWGNLDGNRINHAASVQGRATGDATAIRADGDGGCCVAHGSMVHVYDWTMEELPPLSLDFHPVNDVSFLCTERLVVCTCASVDKPGRGGMASFSSRTGKMQHRFQLCHQGQRKNFTAGALCSGEGHVYASCRGRRDEYGLGVWDQVTGQQVDFVWEADKDWGPLGDAGKLQWLERDKLLMVSTLYPRSDRGHVSVVDFRLRDVVWSWAERSQSDEKVVLDTVAMEDCNTVCVVNQYDNTGFMDLRMGGGRAERGNGHIRWSFRSRPRKMSDVEEKCYSKLAACGTQLFCSSNGAVNVLCAPDWVLTSQLRNRGGGGSSGGGGGGGGGISDIAVGGDRLFVLRNEENLFDVWETPNLVNGSCSPRV